MLLNRFHSKKFRGIHYHVSTLRPIFTVNWLALAWYITSSKTYFQKEDWSDWVICASVCFHYLLVIFLMHQQISDELGKGIHYHPDNHIASGFVKVENREDDILRIAPQKSKSALIIIGHQRIKRSSSYCMNMFWKKY